MTARRRRARRGRAVPVIVLAAAVLAALHPVVIAWLFVGACALAAWRYRHLFRRPRPVRRPAPRRTAPARPARTAASRRPAASPSDARARKNGWLPPASPRLVMIGLTPECASGECAVCPGGDCGCPCGHVPAVIVAMNTARTDDDGRPPF